MRCVIRGNLGVPWTLGALVVKSNRSIFSIAKS